MGIAPGIAHLRAGPPVRLDDAVVVPVEETLIDGRCGKGMLGILAHKRAAYVVVCTAREKRAFDDAGHELPLEPLLARVEGLAAVLRGLDEASV